MDQKPVVPGTPADTWQSLGELTTRIVTAYVSRNSCAPGELGRVVKEVREALAAKQPWITEEQLHKEHEVPTKPARAANPDTVVLNVAGGRPLPAPAVPAVPVSHSITHDHITCLECGKKFSSLKGHLKKRHELTPREYRAKYKLSSAYPMVTMAYSEKRAAVARKTGLGSAIKGRHEDENEEGRNWSEENPA